MGFDLHSTADDVLSGIDLSGKTVIVTGASAGIGEETARAMVAHGAAVTLAARSPEKLAAVAERIHDSTGHKVEIGVLELDKPASVRAFAAAWLAQHDTLDILVNNAGIMACPLTRTTEGWELQFATNHLGHFLLTNLLLPALKAGAPSRVVSVSSGGHNMAAVEFDDVHYERREYSEMDAYGQSKTANIWFANELDRRFKDEGIRAFSLHPGGIQTELARYLTDEVMSDIMKVIEARADGGEPMKSVPQGAATSCWAATSADLDGKGGLYFVDCQVAPAGENISKHHAPWAYDEHGARRLWDVSNRMLGTDY